MPPASVTQLLHRRRPQGASPSSLSCSEDGVDCSLPTSPSISFPSNPISESPSPTTDAVTPKVIPTSEGLTPSPLPPAESSATVDIPSTTSIPQSASSSAIILPSNTSTTSSNTLASKSKSNAGPIAGGVIGAVILVGLIVGALLFWRKRRSKRRMAPSAEFMHHSRLQPSLSAPPLLARDVSNRDSEDEDAQPPPFSRGTFNDPIFEKLSAAAAQRQEIEQMQLYHPYYRDGDEKDPAYLVGESGGASAAAATQAAEDVPTVAQSESSEALRRRPSL